MTFFARLFGTAERKNSESDLHSRLSEGDLDIPQAQPQTQNLRVELLRLTLRDTLRQSGIPTDWIGADPMLASTRSGNRGVHWRLCIKHWNPRLMLLIPALQERLIGQLKRVDQTAEQWLVGLSWEMKLGGKSSYPAMPPPASWKPAIRQSEVSSAGTTGSGNADVISGPVRIRETAVDKDALGGVLSERDLYFARQGRGTAATQPMDLRPQPAKFR